MENNNIMKIIILIITIMILIAALPMIIMSNHITAMQDVDINLKIRPVLCILIITTIMTIWGILKYNRFSHLREEVKQAKSGIDIYLKQRFDLIPNLVEIVKATSNYEKSLVVNITKLRSEYDAIDKKDLKQSEDLNNRYTSLLQIVEGYPELKSVESFLSLQKSLKKVENQLQAARRIYNAEVTNYNISIKKFPSSIIAKIFKFKEELLFEIIDLEKENIEVNI